MTLNKIIESFSKLRRKIRNRLASTGVFTDSETYWDDRYRKGGDSGDGSYGRLAEFKAKILNNFVDDRGITKVVEFGCGDGNQLALSRYPEYVGYDVSTRALEICREKFKRDPKKTFVHLPDFSQETADLCISLDVIFHLIEDQIYMQHMQALFETSTRFVIIYASDTDAKTDVSAPHFLNRRFTDWVDQYAEEWRLREVIKNEFPFDSENGSGSLSDFYIFEKC